MSCHFSIYFIDIKLIFETEIKYLYSLLYLIHIRVESNKLLKCLNIQY